MMNKIDFSLIKIPVLIFIISLLLSSLLIIAINHYQEEIKQDLSHVSQSISSSTEILKKRLTHLSIYKKWHNKFYSLIGFSFQKSDKLSWTEAISQQADLINIPSLTYNIKPRHVDPDFGTQLNSENTVYSTSIEFSAGLLHEDQLLKFVNALENSHLGVFSVEHCEIMANGNQSMFAPQRVNITAQCSIVWYEVDKMSNDFSNDMNGDML